MHTRSDFKIKELQKIASEFYTSNTRNAQKKQLVIDEIDEVEIRFGYNEHGNYIPSISEGEF